MCWRAYISLSCIYALAPGFLERTDILFFYDNKHIPNDYALKALIVLTLNFYCFCDDFTKSKKKKNSRN